jgi:hypothetical protein
VKKQFSISSTSIYKASMAGKQMFCVTHLKKCNRLLKYGRRCQYCFIFKTVSEFVSQTDSQTPVLQPQ